jgi:hypothetical protein
VDQNRRLRADLGVHETLLDRVGRLLRLLRLDTVQIKCLKMYARLLSVVLVMAGIPSVHADQTSPRLAMMATVIRSCKVSVHNSVESVSEAPGAVRIGCHKQAAWRVDVDSDRSTGKTTGNIQTQGGAIRVTINF